ncbi:MAG: hypothetical protein KAS94_10890 [Desulfobulbaceae bacterium]|jgi:hypothetical protein|nr:hypothetical protein [Desulfobulbaceae bacterium]
MKTLSKTPTSSVQQNKTWRYRLGLTLFFGAFPIFFATPVVIPMLGLSAGESAALIGGILLAVEVLWFASIPLLGKQGFEAVKQRAFGWLKLSSSPVSQARHRFGVALLFGSILLDVLLNLVLVGTDLLAPGADAPTMQLFGLTFSEQATVYVSIQILTTVGIVASLFILGADFWERLKAAFEWQGSDK